MKLKYKNPDASVTDVQMPSIQTEPLVDGSIYEVDDALGTQLAELPHWTVIAEKKEPAKSPAPSTRKTRE